MKTKQQIIDFCLTLPGTYLDYPFDDKTAVLRHKDNKKIFVLFTSCAGAPVANLKCEPMRADFWRNVYCDVLPGFHMNKTHWNSVLLEGNVPEHDLLAMISDSYHLTKPKKKSAPQKKQPLHV